MADINSLVEQLGKLTLQEAADLANKLEEEWGVTATAGMVPAAVADAPTEAKSTATVMITGFADGKKIGVLKKVKEILGLGLLEAKNFVEGLPKAVKEDIEKSEAEEMKKALEELRNTFGEDIYIIAGNVCTLEGVNDVSDWGANAVRCNIGGGSICSTRIVTGHGLPGLQTIFDCARTDREVAIIADGGIKTSGDIVKALAAGADFVMCGSLLAGTQESPGQVVTLPDLSLVKEYRGMASKDAQMNWRNRSSTPEGVASYIPYKGSVTDILQDLKGGIQSGFSYTGARTIAQLQHKAEWARQTSAGTVESGTHILTTQNGRKK